ncbi:LTA synthase family protein [Gilvimarinus algae]|uniref:LTA synthase family protein n=1 Tax=Gilvimarinus algae TaxID=3058037 RepID=A0ABT8TCT3_9GAMM|nr:LTA synthase family protein [Gilvimarinus sp. SDUM040014]MDO3381188.1 LTA synthase family protein [Gilvimarinus sp. SDUM040014]
MLHPRTNKPLLIIAALLILPLALDDHLSVGSSPVKLAANILPLLLAYLLFFGVTRRAWCSLLFTACAGLAVFSAHKLKLEHLNQPLTFADAFLAGQTIANWNLLSLYAPKGISLILAAGVALTIYLFIKEPAIKWRWAPPTLLVSLVGFALISDKAVSPELMYSPKAHGAEPWATSQAPAKQGLLASLVTGARSAQLSLPEVNHALVDQFLRDNPIEPDFTQTDVRPDIVLWLAESFFNPGIIQGVDSCALIPQFCALSNTALKSIIDVPTFGGNTTRTEFEVLTAIPFHALGTKDYPYISIVHAKQSSIVWSLSQLGYQTTAMHPNNQSMWQRDRALPLLGFDQFFDIEHFDRKRRDGIWVSDLALAETIKSQLEGEKEPQFIFAISMEGHGPFDTQPVIDSVRRDNIQAPSALDKKASAEWREFIYHAQNASATMIHLKKYIAQRERPTLVVFFGDHLPNLKRVFAQVSFENGRKAWQQNTPALAFANYPIASNWLPKASHELGVWTLELAGLSKSTDYQLLSHALSENEKSKGSIEEVVRNLQLQRLFSAAQQ